MLKKYKGTIKSGKLVLQDEDIWEMNLQALEGQNIEITISKQKSNRSIQQNRYLWGGCYKLISEYTGYTIEEVHELCKSMFLKKHLDIVTKDKIERYTVIGSTAILDKVTFGEYVNNVRDWASIKLGLFIPDPGEFILD